jgi:hypothetical protein
VTVGNPVRRAGALSLPSGKLPQLRDRQVTGGEHAPARPGKPRRYGGSQRARRCRGRSESRPASRPGGAATGRQTLLFVGVDHQVRQRRRLAFTVVQCQSAPKGDPGLECAPRGGQFQAAGLTACRAC